MKIQKQGNNETKTEVEEIIQFDQNNCPYKRDYYDENCQWRTCNMECYSE